MAVELGSAVLGAVGHIANLGTFAEMGQSQAHQQEQIKWTRRAYRLDKHAIRIDLLNAAKEDIRDHYETYITRIDTMLLVHTLLFTFALATLQFSDSFVLQAADVCPNCIEVRYAWITYLWIILIVGMIVFPFWSMVSSIWCKLQLDNWLENSVATLNQEFRSHLWTNSLADEDEVTKQDEAKAEEAIQEYITNLGRFVMKYQYDFNQLWSEECELLVKAASRSLWVSAGVAVCLTALMFGLFLGNRGDRDLALCFSFLVSMGIFLPGCYTIKVVRRRRKVWHEEAEQSPITRRASTADLGMAYDGSPIRSPSRVNMTSDTPRRMSSTADIDWGTAMSSGAPTMTPTTSPVGPLGSPQAPSRQSSRARIEPSAAAALTRPLVSH